jgi:transcription-repair coupling factor (superfamily II helicase)
VAFSNLVLDAVGSCAGMEATAAHLPSPGQRAALGGAVGSLASAVVAALHRASPARVLLAVAETPQAAVAAQADMEAVLDREGESYLYPQKEALPYEESEPHLEIGGLRVEAVEALFSGRVRLLVTTGRALQERVPLPARLAELRKTFRVGDHLDFSSLAESLEERGFERVPLVEEVGQFAVRGGILDVFSVAAGDPVRIEFWGDEIVSIRLFDVLDQRSTSEVSETHVLPTDFRRDASDADEQVSGRSWSCFPATRSSSASATGISTPTSSAPGLA